MTLRLYDTASRSVRDFTPAVPGLVGLYNCGATVQASPHIGHLRGAGVVYDVLRRWLEYRGYQVRHVRNVTDIDDKILARSAEAGRPWWEWAADHERAFSQAYEALGCLPPHIEPRATGHIPQIVAMISDLIEAEKAYAAGGDVYFAVREQADYGFLSGQKLDEMEQGESWGGAKKDPADFTMWKGAKPGEPSWDSPWGPGRPGWHIECSAMAGTYLGPEFDIHGGGLDLIFPHHENEAAQSHGRGEKFARFWVHSHWVTMAGEKMSKSVGNTLSIPALTREHRPIELRYYLVATHYRSAIEYSPEALTAAATAFRRIEGFLLRAARIAPVEQGELPVAFAEAMDDDLGVPRALAVLQEFVKSGNTALSDGDHVTVAMTAGAVRGMLAVLGLDPFAAPWNVGTPDHTLRAATDALLSDLLEQRATARANRDFATADAIRTKLAAAGFAIEDTPDGPIWSVG